MSVDHTYWAVSTFECFDSLSWDLSSVSHFTFPRFSCCFDSFKKHLKSSDSFIRWNLKNDNTLSTFLLLNDYRKIISDIKVYGNLDFMGFWTGMVTFKFTDMCVYLSKPHDPPLAVTKLSQAAMRYLTTTGPAVNLIVNCLPFRIYNKCNY